MPRPKLRTEYLTPIFATRVRQWGLSRRAAKAVLGLTAMSDNDFWRVLRSDEATPQEVHAVEDAIIRYGREHALPGVEDLVYNA